MKSNRIMIAAAMLAGTIGSGASMAKVLEDDAADRRSALDAEKRKTEDIAAKGRHKPSGSKPVPGGGERECARRAARMAKQSQE